jgi:hypothetical protein
LSVPGHGVPSATGVFVQPLCGSQVPAERHASAAHDRGLPPTQVPFWQRSVCVQTLPSLHAEPFAESLHVVVLTPGWQDWQALEGLGAPAATHAPPMMQLPGASG